jgi:integrase
MAREHARLSDRRARTAKPPKGVAKLMLADGGGLYVQVTVGGDGNIRRSWLFKYLSRSQRRTREMGLGSLHDVTLGEARDRAREYRKLLSEGIDPIEYRESRIAKTIAAATVTMTFDEAADLYIKQHRSGWKNPRHAAEWPSSLRSYASPVIGKMSVADITTAHISKVLDPIWLTKTVTAGRVRGRIESILGWATVKGYRTGDNPARWRGHLQNALPAPAKVKKVEHLASLPYAELPVFMTELRKHNSVSALALEFAILTCVRTADVQNAKHADINIATKVWTIPSFSKTAKEHRVPLSAAALAVLKKARAVTEGIGGDVGASPFVFPSDTSGVRLHKAAMLRLLEKMGRKDGMTIHGCRASFRTWAQEQTSFPWEVAEMALGHTVGTKVERAYARGDALKKRVAIMETWSQYLAKPLEGKVVTLHRKAQKED